VLEDWWATTSIVPENGGGSDGLRRMKRGKPKWDREVMVERLNERKKRRGGAECWQGSCCEVVVKRAGGLASVGMRISRIIGKRWEKCATKFDLETSEMPGTRILIVDDSA